MQELIQQLTEKAGVTTEQATKSVDVMKNFVKEKFPMLGDAVDKMMGSSATSSATQSTNVASNENDKTESSVLDKISDVIPGQVGEKIEDFAKGIGSKIGGIFGK
jgi:hypothetical protein